jgi:hypothetical protein
VHCGKGKPRKAGNHKQKKENKQTQDFLHLSARALAHMPCTRRVFWSCAFSAVELGDKWRLVFAFESQNHDHACAALGTRRMLYVKGFIVSIAVVLAGQAQRHVAQGASIPQKRERQLSIEGSVALFFTSSQDKQSNRFPCVVYQYSVVSFISSFPVVTCHSIFLHSFFA